MTNKLPRDCSRSECLVKLCQWCERVGGNGRYLRDDGSGLQKAGLRVSRGRI